jgi:hypothetical protein
MTNDYQAGIQKVVVVDPSGQPLDYEAGIQRVELVGQGSSPQTVQRLDTLDAEMTTVNAQLAHMTNYAIWNAVNVKVLFGSTLTPAKGDGVTDDTAAIQGIINNNPTKTIYFPDGDYLISSTLTVSNKHAEAVNIIMSKNARIFTNIGLTYLIKMGVSADNVFLTNADRNNRAKRFFIGGVFDCNGVANYGIGFANYIGFTFRDTTIMNFLSAAVDTDFYYGSQNAFTTELIGENINIIGQTIDDTSIGILNRGYDNIFSHIMMYNAKNAIVDYGGGQFSYVHATVAGSKNTGSIFARMTNNSKSLFDHCYSDTYEKAYVNDTSGTITVTSPIFYNYKALANNILFTNNSNGFFKVSNAAYLITTNNFTIYQLPNGFTFDSPNNYFRNLFDHNATYTNTSYLTTELDLGLSLSNGFTRNSPYSYSSPVGAGKYTKCLTLLVHNKYKTHIIKMKIIDVYTGNSYEVLLSLKYGNGYTSSTLQIGALKTGTENIQVIVTSKASSYTNADIVNVYLLNTTNSSLFTVDVDKSLLSPYAIAFNRDAYYYAQTPATTLDASETKILGWSLLNNAAV